MVGLGVVLVSRWTGITILRLNGVDLISDLSLLPQGINWRGLGDWPLPLIVIVTHPWSLQQLAVDVRIGGELLHVGDGTSRLNFKLKPFLRSLFSSKTVLMRYFWQDGVTGES